MDFLNSDELIVRIYVVLLKTRKRGVVVHKIFNFPIQKLQKYRHDWVYTKIKFFII